MILLDTHVVLWWADDDPRLGAQADRRVREAVDAAQAGVSAMSLWEIAMLVRKGRVTLRQPLANWQALAFGPAGFTLVPVDGNMAMDAGSLPDLHGDPADRMIVATARALGCPLMTADGNLLRYAAAGHVEAVDATH